MTQTSGIDPTVPPSGTGSVECDEAGAWWVHLRRCAHVGCCNSSPAQHATAHFHETGHPVMQSFEPGEDWFWSFEQEAAVDGPRLADPQNCPEDQPTPGPAGRVPDDWRAHIH